MLGEPLQGLTQLVSQLVVASSCRRNGLQHRWRKDFAKMWEGLYWEVDCHWDIVGWRASSSFWNVQGSTGPHGELCLPHQERALCSYKDSGVSALFSCGDAQGMFFDWSTPDGSRR